MAANRTQAGVTVDGVFIPQAALEAGWQAILECVRRENPGAVVELVDAEPDPGENPPKIREARSEA